MDKNPELVEKVISAIQKGEKEIETKKVLGTEDFKTLEQVQWDLQKRGIRSILARECGRMILGVFC